MARLMACGRRTRAVCTVARSMFLAALATTAAAARDSVSGPAGMTLVAVPAGSFRMGCVGGDAPCTAAEHPAHTVEITRPFLMGQTEVTYEQWMRVMGRPWPRDGRTAIPEGGPDAYVRTSDGEMVPCGPKCPVSNISFASTVEFLNKLSIMDGLEPCYTGNEPRYPEWPAGLDCTGYRLPTEAEWEYAARAGSDSTYAGADQAELVAWLGESGEDAHVFGQRPAGERRPNAWGFYDMSGNVAERCWDPVNIDFGTQRVTAPYPGGSRSDPLGEQPSGQYRAVRGGGFRNDVIDARVTSRRGIDVNWPDSGTGLRVVRTDYRQAPTDIESTASVSEQFSDGTVSVLVDALNQPPTLASVKELLLQKLVSPLCEAPHAKEIPGPGKMPCWSVAFAIAPADGTAIPYDYVLQVNPHFQFEDGREAVAQIVRVCQLLPEPTYLLQMGEAPRVMDLPTLVGGGLVFPACRYDGPAGMLLLAIEKRGAGVSMAATIGWPSTAEPLPAFREFDWRSWPSGYEPREWYR